MYCNAKPFKRQFKSVYKLPLTIFASAFENLLSSSVAWVHGCFVHRKAINMRVSRRFVAHLATCAPTIGMRVVWEPISGLDEVSGLVW
jgi:hypothetical protein